MKIDKIRDSLRRCLTKLDSAGAGELRYHTLEHFRSYDADWEVVRGLHCPDVARLNSLYREEGNYLADLPATKVLQQGGTIERLLATNHETVQFHNRESKSGRTHRERHERRRAIKRVVYELDRMVWLAADPWIQGRGTPSVFVFVPKSNLGWSFLDLPGPRPANPALRKRTLYTSDSLGRSHPESDRVDWCDLVMPATWSIHDVREFVLSKSVWREGGREVFDKQDEFLKKFYRELPESQLDDNEAYCGGFMDAFLAARELASRNNWIDAPELPKERSLSSPLTENDIDAIDEIRSLLAGLVDWLDSKATMGRETSDDGSTSGSAPTSPLSPPAVIEETSDDGSTNDSTDEASAGGKITSPPIAETYARAKLTWLVEAGGSGKMGDELLEHAAELALRALGKKYKSSVNVEKVHQRYIVIQSIRDSREQRLTGQEIRVLIDRLAPSLLSETGADNRRSVIDDTKPKRASTWMRVNLENC